MKAAWLVFVAVLLASPCAWADFTPEQRQSDFSAFTMNRGELRLGLFQEEYAILNRWAVGTYLAPWILIPITKSPVISFYTKVKLVDVGPLDHDRFALAARANFLWADIKNFHVDGVDEGNFQATILPLTLSGSYVFDDTWTATLESTFVQTWLGADVSSTSDSALAGVGAQRNFQLAAIGEMRLSRHVALNLVLRYAPWVQDLRVQSEVQVSDSISTSIDASLSAPASGTAWLVQPGVTCSWGNFNLQVGVGYGNLFLPGIKTVGEQRTIIPDFDAYFRF